MQSDEAGAAVQDRSAAVMAASEGDAPVGELTVTGIVKQGVINGIQDKTPIYVRIFDENWNELEYQELQSGDSYTVTASSGSGIYHVKYESDGYLPFYLKDFGTGTYTVGSGDSRNAVTLVPGDTTWNEEHDNEWSSDVINGKDLAYVQSCLEHIVVMMHLIFLWILMMMAKLIRLNYWMLRMQSILRVNRNRMQMLHIFMT